MRIIYSHSPANVRIYAFFTETYSKSIYRNYQGIHTHLCIYLFLKHTQPNVYFANKIISFNSTVARHKRTTTCLFGTGGGVPFCRAEYEIAPTALDAVRIAYSTCIYARLCIHGHEHQTNSLVRRRPPGRHSYAPRLCRQYTTLAFIFIACHLMVNLLEY